jgi:pantoate--beta-alanine ligase
LTIEPITTTEHLLAITSQFRHQQQTIGVVPTMGALHEGHLSLVRQSLAEADQTIVTIFVNPTQFAPTEDLQQYPRPLSSDLDALAHLGVQHVFVPAEDQMYPDGFSTGVHPPKVAEKLEGEFRPTHFAGVATVVLKLLNMTQADIAFFGQKDYQQSRVIQTMVADLNLNVDIRICPIVREIDGLALSSRNVFLDQDEREVALVLSQTLAQVEQMIREGQNDGFEIVTEMRQRLIDGGVTSVDYAVVADPVTLATAEFVTLPVVALIAAHVGQTRLIDNRVIQ